MNNINFNQFLQQKPHDIHEVFISDLHLDKGSALVDAFLVFLDLLATLPNLKKLYILGDWFEVWIGDDSYQPDKQADEQHWISPIVSRLKQLRISGCRVLIMTGNRDFLMRQPFCDTFSGELITEPYFFTLNQQVYRLEHGDALCTDDKGYQRFRKYAHNPWVQWWLLRKSMDKRLAIADKLRQKSKQANKNKSTAIMDVNADAVVAVFQSKKSTANIADILIHGHTHRPAKHLVKTDIDDDDIDIDTTHTMGTTHTTDINTKTRYVLGDWRLSQAIDDKAVDSINDIDNIDNKQQETVTAVVGVICANVTVDGFQLMQYVY